MNESLSKTPDLDASFMAQEKDLLIRLIAHEFTRRTEDYDRMVCADSNLLGPRGIIPSSPEESMLVQRNAAIVAEPLMLLCRRARIDWSLVLLACDVISILKPCEVPQEVSCVPRPVGDFIQEGDYIREGSEFLCIRRDSDRSGWIEKRAADPCRIYPPNLVRQQFLLQDAADKRIESFYERLEGLRPV